MNDRNFNSWLSGFRDSIADYGYYIDFSKVHKKVDEIKVELNILNSLVGSKNIETEFDNLIKKYPEVLRCIPLLLAVRANEIYAIDGDGEFVYNFKRQNLPIEQYKVFMKKTGLFNLMSEHIINNIVDYATGVETNCYTSGGSKLNETARSYKQISQEVDTIDGVTFVWFTDGKGWKSARHNLEEVFDVMQNIYNIRDLENGIINEVIK